MRFLRRKKVQELTGLAATTLNRLELADQFPKRRQLGANSVGWLEGEVIAWLESRPVAVCRPVAVPAPGKRRGRPAKQKAA